VRVGVRRVVGGEGAHAHRAQLEVGARGHLLEVDREAPLLGLDRVPEGAGGLAHAALDLGRSDDADGPGPVVLVEGAEQEEGDAPEVVGVEVGHHDHVDLVMLWKQHESDQHAWGMAIDLNRCNGCSACLIGCQAENNVPVVGKEEVYLRREMHWIRIDRYYKGPADNPETVFQPMMCQHCGNAPCESVCPVLATVHSSDGLNQQVYNRCVGTRYCANNCPYKVRRFNWFLFNNNDEFDFHFNDDLGKMVINPDVTVRSRGVIEKCSLCIQMTQKSILDAKREGREVRDEEFQTACANACDTGALVFGDINDKESEVSKLKESNRVYHLLESVGTRPNVFYHVKVRNTDDA